MFRLSSSTGLFPWLIQEHFPVPRIQKTDEELRVHFISKVVDVLVMMCRRVSAVQGSIRQSSILQWTLQRSREERFQQCRSIRKSEKFRRLSMSAELVEEPLTK